MHNPGGMPACVLVLVFVCAYVCVSSQTLGLSRQVVEPLKWRIVQLWMPVNLIFVGMIASSFLALRLIGVGESNTHAHTHTHAQSQRELLVPFLRTCR